MLQFATNSVPDTATRSSGPAIASRLRIPALPQRCRPVAALRCTEKRTSRKPEMTSFVTPSALRAGAAHRIGSRMTPGLRGRLHAIEIAGSDVTAVVDRRHGGSRRRWAERESRQPQSAPLGTRTPGHLALDAAPPAASGGVCAGHHHDDARAASVRWDAVVEGSTATSPPRHARPISWRPSSPGCRPG